jgi:hypothetical protein
MTALAGWQNFYVIVGSSAGALIGLQFVVITLIANMPVGEAGAQASRTYATPTVIHLGAVLLLSALLNVPWQGVTGAAILWGLLGLVGITYEISVARRMATQHAYRPEFEDWLFHAVLPFLAYALLAASAYASRVHARAALFGVGAAALLLLYTSIHNAWDSVTYHVFVKKLEKERAERRNPE